LGALPLAAHVLETVAGKPATCTESGYEAGSRCKVCGASVSAKEIPPLGHDTITIPRKEPKCGQEGHTEGLYCQRCKKYVVEATVIPALEHNYVIDSSDPLNYPPTCGTWGYETKKCTNCGHKFTTELPPTGQHNYGEDGRCTVCKQKKPE
jgi:hypothetical protein